MGYLFEMDAYDRTQVNSWVTTLLHNAPQTEKFFDPNISLGEIKNRATQKKEWRDSGKSLSLSETSKKFERSNVQTMKLFRNEAEHVFQYAFKYHKASDANQVLSVKNLTRYIEFREKQVYEGKITFNSFSEYMSKMRVLCAISTATENYPNVNVDKNIKKAVDRIEKYAEENKGTDKELATEKHSIHAFTNGEEKQIIAGIKNQKAKLACEIIDRYCFRIENVSTIHLNTEWKYNGKKWVRVPTDEPKIALVSKGTQRHTVTLDKDLFERLKAFANKKNIFHVAKSTIRDNVKKSAKKLGLKCTVHNLRATAARNLFYVLQKVGYTYEESLQLVSNKLFHGRKDITLYYINSALAGEE